jgi:hypothetical protein
MGDVRSSHRLIANGTLVATIGDTEKLGGVQGAYAF